ncbi:hypothetical protein PC9H_002310 [Pleurotus ostreatus]|uniref:Uncharacterized protein n=1 Tax=Pleurotus ostreatus TaxID=5322 RepID=A0A8H6ZGI3_PLEOS|nr:uncharacterized protein PC9H_002310 [Pleurotus ostreatus]KAF7416050.1 hypothetical protein PC9H_002310 [Pleurotus ostreatus]KAJ8688856.1 hypothetical protein PTI98_012934 [Pleurotus ostreatus]
MSSRHHIDPRAANPTVVPQFPRPFDGNKTAPPQVLAINPLLTIGTPRTPTPDEIIDVDAIPRARDKVKCECGVVLTRSYLEKHRLTAKHLAAIATQRLAAANPKGQKQKKKAERTNAQARATGSGKANEHGQNGATSNSQQYAVPFDQALFDAYNDNFMTSHYYAPDDYGL